MHRHGRFSACIPTHILCPPPESFYVSSKIYKTPPSKSLFLWNIIFKESLEHKNPSLRWRISYNSDLWMHRHGRFSACIPTHILCSTPESFYVCSKISKSPPSKSLILWNIIFRESLEHKNPSLRWSLAYDSDLWMHRHSRFSACIPTHILCSTPEPNRHPLFPQRC